MTDPIAQLCQIIAERLQIDLQTDSVQIVSDLEAKLDRDTELKASLYSDQRIIQINLGDARGYQIWVEEGGIANVGNHYHINVETLKAVLEAFLEKQRQESQRIPHNLPYSGVTKFVGRETELETLRRQLQQNDRVAVSAIEGMGGIGKTELALQYAAGAWQSGTYSGGVCWLRAREEVGTQIISFARSCLELIPPDDLELVEKVRWCWGRWREGMALLIFDDVQNYEDVRSFLPPPESRFKVLMTTRSRFGSPVKTYEIKVLSEAASLDLLRSLVSDGRVGQDLATAKRVCDWLGYLPLGLELVGRYLARKKGTSIAKLWNGCKRKG